MVDSKICISAHKGNCGIPDLPLAESYRRAIDLGVDYVEFDVRRTKDNMYVICHDEHTPSKRLICELSYEEYARELEDQALTLAQLFAITKGRVGLHLDLKETGYEDDVVQLALRSCPDDELIITSLEDVSVKAIKERFPSQNFPLLKVGLSLGRDPRGSSFLKALRVLLSELFPERRLLNTQADFLVVQYLIARLTTLRYALRKHIPIWVWTVDDVPNMRRFLSDSRITTLVTNKPDVAMTLRATMSPSDLNEE